MKNYIVTVLMKTGTGENETETLTMVRVSTDDRTDILKLALRDDLIIDLIAEGYRFEMYVGDEI